jgi:hypothetical protein
VLRAERITKPNQGVIDAHLGGAVEILPAYYVESDTGDGDWDAVLGWTSLPGANAF